MSGDDNNVSNKILDSIINHYNEQDIDSTGFISKINSNGIKILESR